MFDAAIMAGPIGDVLASGQVVISSVRTLSGMKLSVTVRQGAPKPDISSFDGVKKALLNAKSVAYVDPERGTIGVNAWATVQRLGIVEELRTKTVHGTGGPNAQELVAKGVAEINLGPFYNDARCPASSASARSRGMCRHLHQSLARLAFTRGDQAGARALLELLGRLKPTRYTGNSTWRQFPNLVRPGQHDGRQLLEVPGIDARRNRRGVPANRCVSSTSSDSFRPMTLGRASPDMCRGSRVQRGRVSL